MSLSVFCACLHVYHVWAWCLWRSEESFRSSETGVSYVPPCGCWELNQGLCKSSYCWVNSPAQKLILSYSRSQSLMTNCRLKFLLLLGWVILDKLLIHTLLHIWHGGTCLEFQQSRDWSRKTETNSRSTWAKWGFAVKEEKGKEGEWGEKTNKKEN